MKRLHTFDIGENVQLAMLKSALESKGIACVTRNEGLWGAAGGVPITECYPELWVLNDDDFEAAKIVLARWQAKQSGHKASPWSCPGCGEPNEGQFELCWNCGSARPDVSGSA